MSLPSSEEYQWKLRFYSPPLTQHREEDKKIKRMNLSSSEAYQWKLLFYSPSFTTPYNYFHSVTVGFALQQIGVAQFSNVSCSNQHYWLHSNSYNCKSQLQIQAHHLHLLLLFKACQNIQKLKPHLLYGLIVMLQSIEKILIQNKNILLIV